MSQYTLEDILELIPGYEALPDLMPPEVTADLVKCKPETLARDRATKRKYPYTKFGSRVLYSKRRIAEMLLENSRGGVK